MRHISLILILGFLGCGTSSTPAASSGITPTGDVFNCTKKQTISSKDLTFSYQLWNTSTTQHLVQCSVAGTGTSTTTMNSVERSGTADSSCAVTYDDGTGGITFAFTSSGGVRTATAGAGTVTFDTCK